MSRRQRQFFVGLLFLFVSAAFGFHELTKQKVKDSSGLSVVSGQMSSYSFKAGSRGHVYYYIHLVGYKATFQIPADFLDSFSQDRFQSDLKIGDSISISIPKGNENSLSADKRLFIFSVQTKEATYLDEHDALRIYNSNFPTWASIAFFLSGSGLIFLRPTHTP